MTGHKEDGAAPSRLERMAFYESDCQGHTPSSLSAWAFLPGQSAPTPEGARPCGASGDAAQSSFASFSSLQLQLRLDVVQALGSREGEPWFYLRLGMMPA